MDLAKNNMGAINVLVQLLTNRAFTTCVILEKYNITGSLIWCLYNDVCNRTLKTMINVLDACENGTITRDQLTKAIKNHGDGLDISKY